MTWSEWVREFYDEHISADGRERNRKIAAARMALGDEFERRAAIPRRQVVGNEAGQLCVGFFTDWLNSRPEQAEQDDEMLRAFCANDTNLWERVVIAAAATFAGRDVKGGAFEEFGRESNHHSGYGASYHLPVVAYLDEPDVADAERIYSRLSELLPSDVRTPIGHAGLALRRGDVRLALEHTEAAILLAQAMPPTPHPFGRWSWEPPLLVHRATLMGPDALEGDDRAAALEVAAYARRGELGPLRERVAASQVTLDALHVQSVRVAAAYHTLPREGRRLLLTAALVEKVHRLPIPLPGDGRLLFEAAQAAGWYFHPRKG
jgi:hypothetical protein